MYVDLNLADEATAYAVLLHPHPDYGGNCFHPFIDGLFTRLPQLSVSTLRFNFTSAGDAEARDEVIAAIEVGYEKWPQLPLVLAGYSFGAGIAALVDDARARGWYLLAPPSAMLEGATVGQDTRPKAIVVPEHDQFSPPETVEQLIGSWRSTTMSTLADRDHFLGSVDPVVDHALTRIMTLLSA